MTRLFIALSFLVTFSTLTAQEDFNGMWGGDDSSYLTTIIASEYKVLKVFNTSFEETRIVNEEIIKQKGDKLYTFTVTSYGSTYILKQILDVDIEGDGDNDERIFIRTDDEVCF